MQVEIQKRLLVPLLNRERVTALVTFDGGATPSLLQLKDALSSTLKVEKDVLAVRHAYQRYGEPKARVIAHVYKNREALLRLETLKKTERVVTKEGAKVAPQGGA